MLFAACGENPYDDWANPQSSSEDAKSVQLAVSPASAIDFASLIADSVQLFVPTISASTTSGPISGDEVSNTYVVTLYNEDGTATQTITASENGMVSVADLETAYYNLVGRKPVQRTIRIDIKAYSKLNGESVVNDASTTATLTADAPVISSAYYIVGGTLDWAGSASSKAQKFSHSDADPYDDPVYTITIAASEGADTWFAIGTEEACDAITNNGDWSQLFGTTLGDGGMNNLNVTERYDTRSNLGHDCSFKVPASAGAKYIRVTINVLDQTYLIEPLSFSELIYEIGNEGGWSTSHALYGANFDGNYLGYYYLNGEFKFKPNADNWEGDWEYDGEGKIADNGGPNCPDPGAGYYRITVNLADMTYSLMKVNNISMIGTVNGNWNTDTDLTYNTNTGNWEWTGQLNAGKVKFRVNHDWTYSWGGADGNTYNFSKLTESNGTDLTLDEAGTYKVVLTVHQEKDDCKVTFTKQ